mmetsp:Transcript_53311/g.147276  ORF Transcript_53311/g.147276 Transcript_53311/m.147276 type:complete len:280 (+) Transcript_53311:514-1353(+)
MKARRTREARAKLWHCLLLNSLRIVGCQIQEACLSWMPFCEAAILEVVLLDHGPAAARHRAEEARRREDPPERHVPKWFWVACVVSVMVGAPAFTVGALDLQHDHRDKDNILVHFVSSECFIDNVAHEAKDVAEIYAGTAYISCKDDYLYTFSSLKPFTYDGVIISSAREGLQQSEDLERRCAARRTTRQSCPPASPPTRRPRAGTPSTRPRCQAVSRAPTPTARWSWTRPTISMRTGAHMRCSRWAPSSALAASSRPSSWASPRSSKSLRLSEQANDA